MIYLSLLFNCDKNGWVLFEYCCVVNSFVCVKMFFDNFLMIGKDVMNKFLYVCVLFFNDCLIGCCWFWCFFIRVFFSFLLKLVVLIGLGLIVLM